MKIQLAFLCAAMLSLMATAASAESPSIPLGAEAAGGLAENTIYLYKDDGSGGGKPFQIHPVTQESVGRPQKVPPRGLFGLDTINDAMSSLKWNLPPGVVVVLYQHSTGEGHQLVLWGEGEMNSVRKFGFNDALSRWAWFYAGAAKSPPIINVTPPLGSNLTTALPDSMQLFVHSDFRGQLEPITAVTSRSEGELQPLSGELSDSMSSLRWNLPPGVVVVFYEEIDATGHQLAVWGSGELPTMRTWGFNDQVSRWAWFYIGDLDKGTALVQGD